VSFQEVVHSALTEEAEVAEASDFRGENRMDTHKNEPAAGSCWTDLGHGVQATWSLVSIYDPRRASRSVVISRCLSLAPSRHPGLQAPCPLLEANRTWADSLGMSASDPLRKWSALGASAINLRIVP
jgi:hypothetical protein